ncbi:ABC transporter ATP-binding protein [Celeribacter halophilus]|uniref:ABC transporter ATP-binding protein n=1 Tax=Celeribacter halophilus TaxID=576117 RepID=UPI003A91FBD3
MKKSSTGKVWALLEPQERRNAFAVLALMIVGAFASAAMVGSVYPFLSVLSDPNRIHSVSALAWAYERGGFTSDYDFLVALGIVAICIILASNVFLILQTWVVTKFVQMQIHKISYKLLSHYLSQPYEFFISRHSGDMSTNILSEAEQVVTRHLRPLAEMISAALTVCAVLATLLVANPVVASIAIGVFVLIYSTVSLLSRRYVKRMGQLRAMANKRRFRIAGEALNGIKDIKLLGREGEYIKRFEDPSRDMAHAQIGVGVLSQAPRYAIQIVAFAGIIVLCLLLLDPEKMETREALGGFLPLVGLLAFAGQRLMPEMQRLYSSITAMTSGAATVGRVHEALSTGEKHAHENGNAIHLNLNKELELSKICYTYPNADRHGLSDVSFKIKAGERIGIVGSSGAGKTTLADIILGLLPAHSGTMSADGTKVTPKMLRAWQRAVGYVPQDIFLTDASLSENIAFGISAEDIDQEKVEKAAKIAQIHEFAMHELPNGYATQIGERGVRLSGGQRQRIGIARALYHDADLIVFDEATSALDNLTEREVMSAIEALPGDKTILIIAHRLSTVRACNRIVLLQSGHIEDIGSWEELFQRSESFKAIAVAG